VHRNYEDVYGDPGTPVTRRTSRGTFILAKVDGKRQFLMQGSGASPQGNRPFLDLLDLDTKESSRLWQSSEGFYENTGSLMSDTGVSCRQQERLCWWLMWGGGLQWVAAVGA
jgi:hypothetical protein